MKQNNIGVGGNNKSNARKPEIRDDLDSRKNEEYKTKKEMKKSEVQGKEKQKNNKSEE